MAACYQSWCQMPIFAVNALYLSTKEILVDIIVKNQPHRFWVEETHGSWNCSNAIKSRLGASPSVKGVPVRDFHMKSEVIDNIYNSDLPNHSSARLQIGILRVVPGCCLRHANKRILGDESVRVRMKHILSSFTRKLECCVLYLPSTAVGLTNYNVLILFILL